MSVVATGAIGSAMARVLLDAGVRVTVYNRNPDRAAQLVGSGARAAPSVAAAVDASELTLFCPTDYGAAAALMQDLFDTPRPDDDRRTVVLFCTGTPEEAQGVHRRLEKAGVDHLDAGVQAAPDQIGSDAATFLYSGSRRALELHRDTLALLGSVTYLGESPAAAAVWDLALFGLWYDAQVGLLRAMTLVQAAEVDLEGFVEAATRQLQHVVAATEATARELAARTYPSGPATLAEHLPLLGQLLESRSGTVLGTGGLERVEQLVAQLVERGDGASGLSAITAGGVSAG